MKKPNKLRLFPLLLIISFLVIFATSCITTPKTLKLATTTSTYDSGLLTAILPEFEQAYSAEVDVIAVGTGQAISLGEQGNVDVILVHARDREETFIDQEHGTHRDDVMYNDFILVGPTNDPASIAGILLVSEALLAIAEAEVSFASRGDDSGTHSKELFLWTRSGFDPGTAGDWYQSIGQGMGNTLIFANESQSYTLTDRGTWQSMKSQLPHLKIIIGGNSITDNHDPDLLNPYSVIPVNPNKGNINHELAIAFVGWLTSTEVQQMIFDFKLEDGTDPLFFPNSENWQDR